LNTWPLVWGFLHGPGSSDQSEPFDFRFDLPAQCADALGSGDVDLGLVPCAELDRLEMDFLPGLGIACDGPVRSILLVSKKPFAQIGTLAADSSSRTSVALARLLLAERYGCTPTITRLSPGLENMLAEHDAALIIGDPALRIEPAELPFETLDLGAEWVAWSGLPMVFAVWAGRAEALRPAVARAFRESYRWGRSHTEEIVARAVAERGFPSDLAREYVRRNIVYELGPRHLSGLELFRKKARELE
jgi:predicted solute-binding protein